MPDPEETEREAVIEAAREWLQEENWESSYESDGYNRPGSELIERLMNALAARRLSESEIRRDQAEKEKRLSETIRLLNHLPIQSGESAKEPWVKFNLIDVSKAIEVAEGKTDPSEWVSVPCGKSLGPDGPTFDHSPHHWSEYREGEEPLRIAHYCDGITPSPEEPTDA